MEKKIEVWVGSLKDKGIGHWVNGVEVGNVEMRSSKARRVDFSIVEKYKEIAMDEKRNSYGLC